MTSGSQDMDFAHFGLSLLTNITLESVMEGKKKSRSSNFAISVF